MTDLGKKLEILEKDAKKKNLIISGLPSGPNIMTSARKLLHETFDADQYVADIDTLPASGNNKTRVIVPMNTVDSKRNVLKSSGKLKGCEVFINPDLTTLEQEYGKKIREFANELRAKGQRVMVKNRSMRIDGTWHTVDPVTLKLKKQTVRRRIVKPADVSEQLFMDTGNVDMQSPTGDSTRIDSNISPPKN